MKVNIVVDITLMFVFALENTVQIDYVAGCSLSIEVPYFKGYHKPIMLYFSNVQFNHILSYSLFDNWSTMIGHHFKERWRRDFQTTPLLSLYKYTYIIYCFFFQEKLRLTSGFSYK